MNNEGSINLGAKFFRVYYVHHSFIACMTIHKLVHVYMGKDKN